MAGESSVQILIQMLEGASALFAALLLYHLVIRLKSARRPLLITDFLIVTLVLLFIPAQLLLFLDSGQHGSIWLAGNGLLFTGALVLALGFLRLERRLPRWAALTSKLRRR